MSGRHTRALVAASLALGCTPSPPPDPTPAPAPAPVLVAPPAPMAPAPVRVPEPDPPAPVLDPACPHRTLLDACHEFDTTYSRELEEYLAEEGDCGELESGVMPDGETRYHLVGRMWNDTRQAELLVLESKGCFTLIGDLGWNTMSEIESEVLSTTLKAIDLDDDGDKDEAVFRIVELMTDASTTEFRTSKVRTARYCRVSEGRYGCTELLSGPPRAEDWPE